MNVSKTDSKTYKTGTVERHEILVNFQLKPEIANGKVQSKDIVHIQFGDDVVEYPVRFVRNDIVRIDRERVLINSRFRKDVRVLLQGKSSFSVRNIDIDRSVFEATVEQDEELEKVIMINVRENLPADISNLPYKVFFECVSCEGFSNVVELQLLLL